LNVNCRTSRNSAIANARNVSVEMPIRYSMTPYTFFVNIRVESFQTEHNIVTNLSMLFLPEIIPN